MAPNQSSLRDAGAYISTTGTINKRIAEFDEPLEGQSTLLDYLNGLYRTNSENIAFSAQDHAFAISSTVHNSDAAKRPINPQVVTGLVQQSLPAVNVPRVVVIEKGNSKRLGAIAPEQLVQLAGSGGLNNRGIEGQITSGVGIPQINVGVTRQLIGSYQENINYHDNSYLYAKILFFAMLRESFTTHGVVPQVVQFDVNNMYMHINTAVVNAEPGGYNLDTVRGRMTSGHIFMTHNFGWWPANALIYRILGHTGQYFVSRPMQRHIPASAYSLPGIYIASMAPAVGAMPVAADISSNALFAFAHNLAKLRQETQHLVQGYYMYMAAYWIGADATPYDDCFEIDVPVPPPGQGPWPNEELFAAAAAGADGVDEEGEEAGAAGAEGDEAGAEFDEPVDLNATGPARARRSRDNNLDRNQYGMPRLPARPTNAQYAAAMVQYNQFIARMQADHQQRNRLNAARLAEARAAAQQAAANAAGNDDDELQYYPRITPEPAENFINKLQLQLLRLFWKGFVFADFFFQCVLEKRSIQNADVIQHSISIILLSLTKNTASILFCSAKLPSRQWKHRFNFFPQINCQVETIARSESIMGYCDAPAWAARKTDNSQ